MKVDDADEGVSHWLNFLSQNHAPAELRKSLINSFMAAAQEHNNKITSPIKFSDLLIKNTKKNFLIVAPESAGDLLYVSATLKSFRESYPKEEWNLYLASKPEFLELFDCNPYLDKLIQYHPLMDNEIHMLGQGGGQRQVDGCCFITAGSQRFLNYLGNHNISLSLN